MSGNARPGVTLEPRQLAAVSRRSPLRRLASRLAVAAAGLALLGALLPASTALAASQTPGVTNSWQAKVGPSGLNGTVNVSTVTPSAGAIGLKLVKLRASSTLPVALYKGTCTSVGTVLFRLASITTTSTGATSRTTILTAAQVQLILGATAGTGKIAIRVGSGTATKCGAFAKRAVPGPQAVVQSFYNWWLGQLKTGGSQHYWSRPELTAAFIQQVDSGGPYPFDRFTCAQAFPDWIKAGPAAISGSSATVQITEGFAGNPPPQTVKLTLGPTGWQISAVSCGS